MIIEMERNKEELSKEKTSNKILNEEKDMNNKEFERLLEKYDRSVKVDLYDWEKFAVCRTPATKH